MAGGCVVREDSGGEMGWSLAPSHDLPEEKQPLRLAQAEGPLATLVTGDSLPLDSDRKQMCGGTREVWKLPVLTTVHSAPSVF